MFGPIDLKDPLVTAGEAEVQKGVQGSADP